MELKDLQSDLEALRELYGLIRCGDVTSNVIVSSQIVRVTISTYYDFKNLNFSITCGLSISFGSLHYFEAIA